MPAEALVSAGVPAIEALNTATAQIAQYAPAPAECAGTVDPDLYTTNDVVMGFSSAGADAEEHSAQTIVAADFETADDAAAYFEARTHAWVHCSSVDLTIDATNVLTLRYDAMPFSEADLAEIPELFQNADQDLVLASAGELSGEIESPDVALPNPGTLPDYVISPDDVPEPEAENIRVTSSTVIARYDTQVFWMTVEPATEIQSAVDTLAQVVEAVQDQA